MDSSVDRPISSVMALMRDLSMWPRARKAEAQAAAANNCLLVILALNPASSRSLLLI